MTYKRKAFLKFSKTKYWFYMVIKVLENLQIGARLFFKLLTFKIGK